jgi:hypothetical protein
MKKEEQKARRLRRTHSELESLLKEFESSKDITIKEFCRQHQLGEGTFYNFRKRYRQHSSKADRTGKFIAITSVSQERVAERLFAEVNGIRLYQPVTAEYLKSLFI